MLRIFLKENIHPDIMTIIRNNVVPGMMYKFPSDGHSRISWILTEIFLVFQSQI